MVSWRPTGPPPQQPTLVVLPLLQNRFDEFETMTKLAVGTSKVMADVWAAAQREMMAETPSSCRVVSLAGADLQTVNNKAETLAECVKAVVDDVRAGSLSFSSAGSRTAALPETVMVPPVSARLKL